MALHTGYLRRMSERHSRVTGLEWVGDWHSHVGHRKSGARPSRADLKNWLIGLDRPFYASDQQRDFYLGLIVSPAPGESWRLDDPVVTDAARWRHLEADAFLVRRDTNGKGDVDHPRVELEAKWQLAEPAQIPSWRL